jgi:hypothetical protein
MYFFKYTNFKKLDNEKGRPTSIYLDPRPERGDWRPAMNSGGTTPRVVLKPYLMPQSPQLLTSLIVPEDHRGDGRRNSNPGPIPWRRSTWKWGQLILRGSFMRTCRSWQIPLRSPIPPPNPTCIHNKLL